MKIEINNLPKVSFNVFNNYHWTKKKAFNDTLHLILLSTSRKQFKGGYDLNFSFEFKGKGLDTINVVHYCKKIEDYFFKQDNENRQICINVAKGKENKCTIELIKI